MEFPNALNNFVAQGKKDIVSYMEQYNINEADDWDDYYKEMQDMLFHHYPPQIDVGESRFQLMRERDCYDLIDNDAMALMDIIKFIEKEKEYWYENPFQEECGEDPAIVKLFAQAWFLVGEELIDAKREEMGDRDESKRITITRSVVQDSDSDDE
jgi:hypothetical protein